MAHVRWGIIGCGDVTEVKSGPAFQRASGSELVAVMRRTPSLAEDYAKRHGVPRWYDDADGILQSDDIDAVYIATHPNTHREYALRAAAAGKSVYVEKPMAMSEDECRQMQSACDAAGVALWVAYYRRALPRFERIRTLIADGAIGQVRAVNSLRYQTVSSRAWQNQAGLSAGGYFFDAACHTLDYLDSLFGQMTDIAGLATNHSPARAHEDTVAASYRFESGVIGSGTWCFDSDVDVDTTTVVGSEGTISFSISAPEPIHIVRGRRVEQISVDDPPHVHQPLVQTIVDEVNGVGSCPSTGTTAMRTARVMDQILADVRRR
ncbi:Gfo/Idh/MocA family protein [Glaciibacter superstes]|uniref:Gfo/Idh/MocA family protein n=1 Tax=Glaciibacter superstes TaxID=501023 RepID=UPI0003B44A37|nr:Gfo/Idh/MocA family oxidoreductase [Glaciibacter superstes]